MIKTVLSLSLFCCLMLGLSSCALGPNFIRPQTAATEQKVFINENLNQQNLVISKWWERLNDPILNEYVEILMKENLSLKEAAERMIQARERFIIERGAFFPSIGASADATRSFQPVDSFNIPGASGATRFYNTNLRAQLNTTWQMDLFGKIRRSVESATATFEASQYDHEALVQSLIADLLKQRVAVAINMRLLQLAEENAQSQEKIYVLVKRRYDLGTRGTALSDVYLAEENFRSVRADVHNFERQLAEETYKLDILLGRAPGTTQLNLDSFPLLPPPRDVGISVPASLLDRRPDLRASELRIAAANAEIGVAIADLYPDLTLSGAIGFGGQDTNKFFSAQQLAGSMAANIAQKIFKGGALRANIRLQESEARELAIKYTANVLEAMREVETALKTEKELELELQQKEKSVVALREAERLIESRYRKGIETLREFLETQQRRYLVERNWLRSQQEKWNARVDLYLALGGDWIEPSMQTDIKTKSIDNGGV